MPSSGDKITSLEIPRTVRVAGTTMISLRHSMMSGRVRSRTGRRLSGERKVYHRTSPRFNRASPNRPLPRPRALRRSKTRQRLEAARHTLPPDRQLDERPATLTVERVPAALDWPRAEGYRRPSSVSAWIDSTCVCPARGNARTRVARTHNLEPGTSNGASRMPGRSTCGPPHRWRSRRRSR